MIALDGPSGTGKSTVSQALAVHLAAAYLDTGAMYRAATLAVLRAGLDPATSAAAALAAEAEIELGTDPEAPAVLLAGADVALEIRGEAVTGAVSAVSAHAVVRERLVAHQRRIIDAELAGPDGIGGIVVEGRDIGTVVVPEAGLKIYLIASEEIRAARRDDQNRAAGRGGDLAGTLLAVQRRDSLDSGRKLSPLRAAPDAVTVDTSDLDVAAVQTRVLALAANRGLLRAADHAEHQR
ncbi:MAG: (d)CMP kinase [Pseudonocardiales bacterium]|nr:(d)CMP kinase [Pseudonocardiales bacterium]